MFYEITIEIKTKNEIEGNKISYELKFCLVTFLIMYQSLIYFFTLEGGRLK